MKNVKTQIKGITLVSLVVTIIMLLILAGISISMFAGGNGIFNRAVKAKEATRGAAVQETVTLAEAINTGVDYVGGTKKTRAEVISQLYSDGKLTDSEVRTLEESNTITIGGITIDFSVIDLVEGTTLGAVYDSGDVKIGDKLTYSSNGQSSWIVFGKDSSGNILITTKDAIPIDYWIEESSQNWFNYENDLNDICSVYGGIVQGVTVSSRSIKMEDINYVAGFTKPTFDTYTFGSENDYSNKKVNYYYPSLDASSNGYWQDPTISSTTFQNDWYGYYCNWDDNTYYYYGSDTNGEEVDATTIGINTDDCIYIWGEDTEENFISDYLVASRAVRVYSDHAEFFVARVEPGKVKSNHYILCSSNEACGFDGSLEYTYGVRPVVLLPSSLLVQAKDDGKYDLAE